MNDTCSDMLNNILTPSNLPYDLIYKIYNSLWFCDITGLRKSSITIQIPKYCTLFSKQKTALNQFKYRGTLLFADQCKAEFVQSFAAQNYLNNSFLRPQNITILSQGPKALNILVTK